MSKYFIHFRLVTFLVLASLLLVGCSFPYNPYNPVEDDDTDNASRTFAITDVNPYPGKDYQIPDKQVDTEYAIYIYITNNGGHEKNMSAEDVKVTMIDETHSITLDVATTSISKDGYVVIKDLSYANEAKVHFHVEGVIDKNKNQEIFAKANSNSFNINNPTSTIKSITVSPANPSIQVGQTQVFVATALYSNGSTLDVTNTASWLSSDTSKVVLTGNVATGVSTGTSTITASLEGKSGTANLTVTSLALQKITVTPLNASIQIGQTQIFAAIATYTDGSTSDISHLATWTSSNESKAIMSGSVATGVAAGNSMITAVFRGQSGAANLTVTVPPDPEPSDGRLIWEKEIVDE